MADVSYSEQTSFGCEQIFSISHVSGPLVVSSIAYPSNIHPLLGRLLPLESGMPGILSSSTQASVAYQHLWFALTTATWEKKSL